MKAGRAVEASAFPPSWFDRLIMRAHREDLILSLSKDEVRPPIWLG
jgi:hypothetical protein